MEERAAQRKQRRTLVEAEKHKKEEERLVNRTEILSALLLIDCYYCYLFITICRMSDIFNIYVIGNS